MSLHFATHVSSTFKIAIFNERFNSHTLHLKHNIPPRLTSQVAHLLNDNSSVLTCHCTFFCRLLSQSDYSTFLQSYQNPIIFHACQWFYVSFNCFISQYLYVMWSEEHWFFHFNDKLWATMILGFSEAFASEKSNFPVAQLQNQENNNFLWECRF